MDYSLLLQRLRMNDGDKGKAAMQFDCLAAADAITKLRAERDALAVLLLEMRDASFIAWQLSREGREYIARIDAALKDKP